ncbi:MAG: glycosyltransferase family 39 protein [Bacteroidota bacterium]|nr:glycosyltransferase family 39 protein [Bacteroidota bacterium]
MQLHFKGKSLNFVKNNDNYLLLIIIITAIILRLINPFNIPYTYDEFSALCRTNFRSFSELIEKGVKIDGHPAGVQVFIYYWTKIFGYSELVVKIPFIIAGIISVYLVYYIGKKWFNGTVGLISSSYIATIQYTVMYSQIARPYISGLFFSLMMVVFWNEVVFGGERKKYLKAFLYVIFSSLCCYNHYFSLLFAAIVWITGLFFITRERILLYIVSGLSIFLCFIPHLKIFFYQLSVGGVGTWLGKPHNEFLIQYLKFIFHFSPYVYVLTMGIIILSLVNKDNLKGKKKFILISLSWFLIPLITGFIYSRYVNPVLQFSVLIFSFSYLFFIFSGYIKDLSYGFKTLIVFLILIVNIMTLVYERKYYDLFYNTSYKEILYDHNKISRDFKNKSISVLNIDKYISDYYVNKLKLDSNYIPLSRFGSKLKFIEFLSKQEKNKYLFFGEADSYGSYPELVPIILDYYPSIMQQKNYTGSTSYLFSKSYNRGKDIDSIFSYMDFEKENRYWSGIDKNYLEDTNVFKGKYSYYMSSLLEWGPTFTNDLNKLCTRRNDYIDISVNIKSNDNIKDILLVSSMESNKKIIDWRTETLETYISPRSRNKWVKVYLSVKLSDIYLNYPNIKIKIFVWNRGKHNILIDDFIVKVRKGNPIIYGNFDKF